MTRREIIRALSALGLCAFAETLARPLPPPGRRARVRRRRRRRIRRRVRRRVVFRSVAGGRRLLVVPVAVLPGWELMIDRRVVVVKEIKKVEVDGESAEIMVVSSPDGKTEEIEIIKEDTKENTQEQAGSEIEEGDQDSPYIESEEDE